jgi:cell division transport system permease protein
MHLVGAKNNFIRGPFLVQGILCGFVAALISFVLLFILLCLLKNNLSSLAEGFDIYGIYMANLGLVILLQFGIGIGLGLISSYFAIRKYLKD